MTDRDPHPAAAPDAGEQQDCAGRECGWVIEHNEPLPTGLPLYWRCPTQRLISREIEHVFDPDHEWAVRFARREDAERMIGWLNVPGKAVEHLWVAPAANQTPDPPPLQCPEFEILEAMHCYGGGFVKQLALLFRLADEPNKRKLAEAFRDYLNQYDELAAKRLRETK